MTGAFYDEHAIVKVPFEMLLHGPIILNPVADLRSEARLACNPHFQIFLGTPAFLTDDFMGTVLTKVAYVLLLMNNLLIWLLVTLIAYLRLLSPIAHDYSCSFLYYDNVSLKLKKIGENRSFLKFYTN